MKKAICLIAVIFLLAGCGEIPKLENGKDAIVTFNNDSKISVDDFYEEIKNTYGLSILVNMIDKYVLETTFPDYIEEAKTSATDYMDLLKENYESEDALLRDIQQYYGFATLEDFEDYVYLSNLQSHAVEEYAKGEITDSQINKYYKNNIHPDIEISHILITPEVNDNMTTEEKDKAESKAKETAESIIKTLKKTKSKDLSKKFAELVTKYSKDDATKEKAGAIGAVNYDKVDEKYTSLLDAAYSIKDNNFYAKVVKSDYGYHVIMRTKTLEKASLDSVKEKIITNLTNEKLNSDATISITAIQHYRKELGMDIQDDNLSKQYSNYISYTMAQALETAK